MNKRIRLLITAILALAMVTLMGSISVFAGGGEDTPVKVSIATVDGPIDVTPAQAYPNNDNPEVYFDGNSIVLDDFYYEGRGNNHASKILYGLAIIGDGTQSPSVILKGRSNIHITADDTTGDYFISGLYITGCKYVSFCKDNERGKLVVNAESTKFDAQVAAINSECSEGLSVTEVDVSATAVDTLYASEAYGIYSPSGSFSAGLGANVTATGGSTPDYSPCRSAGILCEACYVNESATALAAYSGSGLNNYGIDCTSLEVLDGSISATAYNSNNPSAGESIGVRAVNSIGLGRNESNFNNYRATFKGETSAVSIANHSKTLTDIGNLPFYLDMNFQTIPYRGIIPYSTSPAELRDQYRSACLNSTVIKSSTFKYNGIENCQIDNIPIQEYTGNPVEPEIQVLDYEGNALTIGTDYTVTYEDNIYCGIATVTIKGIGMYEGTEIKTFPIKRYMDDVKVTLSTQSYLYNGKTKAPSVKVVDADGNILEEDADYSVSGTKSAKNPGTYKITVSGINAFSGVKTASYTIKVKPTTISKLSKGKKSFTVTAKKQSSTNITGYQVRYSTKSSMASSKTVTIGTKTTAYKKTVKKLKAKKKYYVQVRTYKKIGTKKYYSAWSAKKAVTTK